MKNNRHSMLPRFIVISITIVFIVFIRGYFLHVHRNLESWLKAFVLSVLIGTAAVAGILFLHLLLKNLHSQKKLPAWLQHISENGLYSIVIQNPMKWVHVQSRHLLFRLAVSGLFIILFTYFFFSSSSAIDKEVRLYGIVRNIQGQESRSFKNDSITEHSTVIELGFFSTDNNFYTYLQNTLKIVTELKAAGVKAVSVDFRTPFIPGIEELDIVTKLAETGIVVFTQESGKDFGLFNVSDGKLKITKAYYSPDSFENYGHYLHRIQPIFYMPLSDGRWVPRELDASLELLKKYRGYSDTLQPYYKGSTLILGSDQFPLTPDNEIFVKGSGYGKVPHISAYYGKGMGRSGELTFSYKKMTHDGDSSLAGIANHLEGKIVIINWWFRGYFDNSIGGYSDLMKNFLDSQFVFQYKYWHFAITVLCLLLAGWFTVRLRPLYAYCLTLAMAFTLITCGYWLYHSFNILIQLFYPFIVTVLASFAFPSAKLKMEKGIAPWYDIAS
jgi:hypothetical protein